MDWPFKDRKKGEEPRFFKNKRGWGELGGGGSSEVRAISLPLTAFTGLKALTLQRGNEEAVPSESKWGGPADPTTADKLWQIFLKRREIRGQEGMSAFVGEPTSLKLPAVGKVGAAPQRRKLSSFLGRTWGLKKKGFRP